MPESDVEDGQTLRQPDRQMDGQTLRQPDRWTDSESEPMPNFKKAILRKTSEVMGFSERGDPELN